MTIGTFRTQIDVVLPFFLAYATHEQRDRWFPGLAAGELLTAIALTSPTQVRISPAYAPARCASATTTWSTGRRRSSRRPARRSGHRSRSHVARRREQSVRSHVARSRSGDARLQTGRTIDKIGLPSRTRSSCRSRMCGSRWRTDWATKAFAFGYLGHNLAQSSSPSPSMRSPRSPVRVERRSTTSKRARCSDSRQRLPEHEVRARLGGDRVEAAESMIDHAVAELNVRS